MPEDEPGRETRIAFPEPGKVYFVGAGPGAKDLLTLRAAHVIAAADVVVWAGSLVSREVLDLTKSGCRIHDSSRMTLEEIGAVLSQAKQGMVVARLHSGDPSIYGALTEQLDYCERNDIPYEIVPGVSSLSAAAAALKTELTVPGVSQAVIICRQPGRTGGGPGPGDLASDDVTLAVFLSTHMAEKLEEELLGAGLDAATPVAVVYKASWPDQRVFRCRLSELGAVVEEAGIDRTALVLVGGALESCPSSSASRRRRSKLYDPGFGHGFRKKRTAD